MAYDKTKQRTILPVGHELKKPVINYNVMLMLSFMPLFSFSKNIIFCARILPEFICELTNSKYFSPEKTPQPLKAPQSLFCNHTPLPPLLTIIIFFLLGAKFKFAPTLKNVPAPMDSSSRTPWIQIGLVASLLFWLRMV